MGKKKAECTRIVRIYKREVDELENEVANLANSAISILVIGKSIPNVRVKSVTR